jgi:hypothetical protein
MPGIGVAKRLVDLGTLSVLILLGLPPVTAAQPATASRARVALQDEPAGVALRVLDEAGTLAYPIAVRVDLPEPLSAASIDDRLTPIERRRLPLWLAIQVPRAQSDLESWRTLLRTILDRRQSEQAILELVVDGQPSSVARFAIEVAATEARARRADIQVALGGSAANDSTRRSEIYTDDLAPYVDLLVIPDQFETADTAWLRQVDPLATIAVRSTIDAPVASDASRRVIDDVLGDFDTEVSVRAWRASDVTPAALRSLTPLSALMTHPLSAIDSAGVGLKLTVGQEDVTTRLRHRLLFDTRTFSTYLIYWGEAGSEPLGFSLTLPVEGRPGVHDLLTGTRPGIINYSRDNTAQRVQAAAPLTGGPMLIDFNEEATELIAERADVSARRQLSIAEIISRHQQTQLAQDVVVRNYSATVRMRQYFRPTVTDSGYDVVTENRYFSEGTVVEWEELSFSVNGSRWESDRPPFPLLQPEKVMALPLQLRFDEGYSYELQGTERVEGLDCYVVQFEPIRKDSALYHGTVWIDERTFARIRVHAVQSGLAAPVVSTDETMRYTYAATIENQPVFLFTGLSAKQIVFIAGRNLLVEKDVTFREFHVNEADFETKRAMARTSDHIMLRQTDGGLRYYVKQGDSRVVDESPTTHVKAMAMGVYLDPSYAFPLPIFGINYLNFSLGGSSQQLALLFGGVLAAGNIQRPKIGSTRVNGSVDFFAIAVPSSDRVYGPGGEAESERLLTWPLSTGLNLGWQATPFQRATLQYQLRFDAYVRDQTTAATFQPPPSTLTNGIGGAWEYRRGGYNLLASATWYARAGWAEWGTAPPEGQAPSDAPASSTYAKYSVGLSKDVFLGPFQKFNVNGAWFGGRDLDRFVQYQFGMFDETRIHGVPASGVRFGELAMLRGSYSFNVFDQYRLDVFAEHAWGRTGSEDSDWQPIPGIGAAVNFRAPWNTILRAEIGESRLPERYSGLGSTTLQVLLLKPMR